MKKPTIKKFKSRRSYELVVELVDIKPKIWRRLIVDSNIYLISLHRILQTTMGWTNSHLHSFTDWEECEYSPEELEVEYTEDSRRVKLSTVLFSKGMTLDYLYDFGDYWMHKIKLVKVYEADLGRPPICLEGQGNCPPEDCGGAHGFMELLKVFGNPKHPEYESFREWYGDDYDPDKFEADEVSYFLKQKGYGCL